jgi:hypothetical protein
MTLHPTAHDQIIGADVLRPDFDRRSHTAPSMRRMIRMPRDSVHNQPAREGPLTKVTTIEELERLYGAPSQVAIIKEINYISDHYRAFIEKAPCVIVASSGPQGLDCSPRGDPAGFVRVQDRKRYLSRIGAVITGSIHYEIYYPILGYPCCS